MKLSLISLLGLLLATSCVMETTPFKEGKILNGKEVDKATLNLGYTTYVEYCIQCHGKDGKGDGPASKGLLPPPRNFTQGLYKFSWTQYGELPHDEDLARIIRGGLKGTAMLPWDISDERLNAVIQYIKTFAPAQWEGKDKVLGTKFELPTDPFGTAGRSTDWEQKLKLDAIEKGRKVYHVTAACVQCHRAYETKAQITAWGGDPSAADLYQLKPQDGEYNYKVLPPDFTYHELRSVTDLESLVQRLMYGVSGSGMPGWKDVITDEEIWAVAYYVQHLQQMKGDQKARNEMMDKLKAQ